MLSFFIFFLMLIVPGLIASFIYNLVSCNKIKTCCKFITLALIFDLFILIINLAGLYIFKGICTLEKLVWYFNCLSFTCKYGLLGIAVGIILGTIAGIICRLCSDKKKFFKK